MTQQQEEGTSTIDGMGAAVAAEWSEPCLVRLTGVRTGETTELEEGTTLVGRLRSEVDLCLRHGSVSRLHARIQRDGDDVILEDRDSTNGTLVNGEEIDGSVRLEDGDKISFGGENVVRYRIQTDAASRLRPERHDGSIRDERTSTLSRAYLEEQMRAEMAYAERHETDLAFVLLSVDYFDEINDTYGQSIAEKVLKKLGGILEGTIRTEDLLARYSDDQFAVLMRDVGPETLEKAVERMHGRVDAHSFEFEEAVVRVTVSAGATLYSPLRMNGVEDLMNAADAPLYEAKEAGRNEYRVRDDRFADLDRVRETLQ